MVNVFIDDPDLFSFGRINLCRNDFDGAIGTVGLTDPASCAAMLVVRIMRHDDLTFEPVVHFQCFPVLRVLLGNDLPGAEKIFPGNGHPCEQGFHSGKDICEIVKEAVHSLKMPTH